MTQKVRDLADFLSRVPPTLALMQTPEQLRSCVTGLFDQLAADNVIYAEIRFAPHLHLEKGLSPEQVVETVAEAIDDRVAATGIEAGLILCSLRHYDAEMAMATARLVDRFRDRRVVALDLAADEAGFPIAPQIDAFRYARERDLSRTAHAGEAKGPESVWETLEVLVPQRIGHGVRAIEDSRLVAHLRETGIHLEVCPGCNVLIDVYDRLEDHPIDALLRAGVSVSINTDGRSLPMITQNDQYRALVETFGWGEAELMRCAGNAIDAAFTDAETRQRLHARLGELSPS